MKAMSHVSAMSHVAEGSRVPAMVCQPMLVGMPANVGWQWTPTVVGKVRGPREVYIAPIAPIGNQSCFTRKTTSHPAHTSKLGKVDTVPYK